MSQRKSQMRKARDQNQVHWWYLAMFQRWDSLNSLKIREESKLSFRWPCSHLSSGKQTNKQRPGSCGLENLSLSQRFLYSSSSSSKTQDAKTSCSRCLLVCQILRWAVQMPRAAPLNPPKPNGKKNKRQQCSSTTRYSQKLSQSPMISSSETLPWSADSFLASLTVLLRSVVRNPESWKRNPLRPNNNPTRRLSNCKQLTKCSRARKTLTRESVKESVTLARLARPLTLRSISKTRSKEMTRSRT